MTSQSCPSLPGVPGASSPTRALPGKLGQSHKTVQLGGASVKSQGGSERALGSLAKDICERCAAANRPDLAQPITSTLKSLQGAVQSRNMRVLAERLTEVQGAKYWRLIESIRSASIWSLEELLATRVCRARAQYDQWRPKYKAHAAALVRAIQDGDVGKLRLCREAWPFDTTDPYVAEADRVLGELEQEYKATLFEAQQAHAERDVAALRGFVRGWKFRPDDPNLRTGKEFLTLYAQQRRHCKAAIKAKGMLALAQALQSMGELKNEDSDVSAARQLLARWEQALVAARAPVAAAMAKEDLEELQALLTAPDLDFHCEELGPARRVLRSWLHQRKHHHQQLVQAMKERDVQRVRDAVAAWEGPRTRSDDALVQDAQKAVDSLEQDTKEVLQAVHARDVPRVEALVLGWRLGEAPLEARELLDEVRLEQERLRRAVRQKDVEQVGRLLPGLAHLPAALLADAQKILQQYEAAKERLLAPDAIKDMQRRVQEWPFPPCGALDEAKARCLRYQELCAALQQNQQVGELRARVDQWPFDTDEPAYAAALKKVAAYAVDAERVEEAMRTNDIGVIGESLGGWTYGNDDPVYAQALGLMDKYSEQVREIRRVSELAEAKEARGADLKQCLNQLTFESDDVAVVEMQVLVQRYEKHAQRLRDAEDDPEELQALLDDWEWHAEDAAAVTAREVLAPPTITTTAPAAPNDAPATPASGSAAEGSDAFEAETPAETPAESPAETPAGSPTGGANVTTSEARSESPRSSPSDAFEEESAPSPSSAASPKQSPSSAGASPAPAKAEESGDEYADEFEESKAEPEKAEPEKAESEKAESEPARAESEKAEPEKAESEPANAESEKAEPKPAPQEDSGDEFEDDFEASGADSD